jgi:hypothetical protein
MHISILNTFFSQEGDTLPSDRPLSMKVGKLDKVDRSSLPPVKLYTFQ